MKYLLLAGMASCTFSAAVAVAAEMPAASVKQAGVSDFSWAGFYAGIQGGYGWGEVDGSADGVALILESLSSTPETGVIGLTADEILAAGLADAIEGAGIPEPGGGDDDLEGAVGGVTVGFNWQSGWFVFGLEGDFSASDISQESSLNFDDVEIGGLTEDGLAIGDLSAIGTFETEVDWLATARGRVGGAFDRFMIYATGGAAFAKINVSREGVATFDGEVIGGDVAFDGEFLGDGVGDDDGEVELGYVVGAGVEFSFTDKLSAKLEYNYLNFSDIDSGAFAAGDDSPDLELELHIVKAGVNYRF